MARSDCRSAAPPLPGFAGYRRASLPITPQATGPRRLSRVPRTTLRTFNAQYAGGSLSARFWIPGTFHGLRRSPSGSAPSLSRPKTARLTTLTQASLALQTARSHPPCFAPGLSTTHEGIATRDPDVSPDQTHTGRPSRTCRSVTSCRPSFLMTPEQSRRTDPKRDSRRKSESLGPQRPRHILLPGDMGRPRRSVDVQGSSGLHGVHAVRR